MASMTIALALAAAQPAAPAPDAAQAPWPGAQAGWVQLFDHGTEGTSYYDPASVRRAGPLVQVWIRWDRSQVAGSAFIEGRILDELDCPGRQVRLMRYVAIAPGGGVLVSGDSPEPWSPVNPGTPGGALFALLCQAPPN